MTSKLSRCTRSVAADAQQSHANVLTGVALFGMPLGSLLLAFSPYILGLGAAFYLGLRAVRAMERRASSRRELDALNERTLRVEERLADMADQLGRLADGQEFTTKLLAERKPPVERGTT